MAICQLSPGFSRKQMQQFERNKFLLPEKKTSFDFNLQLRFMLNSFSLNSYYLKRIPQFQTTDYLAKKRVL